MLKLFLTVTRERSNDLCWRGILKFEGAEHFTRLLNEFLRWSGQVLIILEQFIQLLKFSCNYAAVTGLSQRVCNIDALNAHFRWFKLIVIVFLFSRLLASSSLTELPTNWINSFTAWGMTSVLPRWIWNISNCAFRSLSTSFWYKFRNCWGESAASIVSERCEREEGYSMRYFNQIYCWHWNM